jgi:hypothetical protein
MKEKNIGSTFDSWLREEGIYREVTATAIKRALTAHNRGELRMRTDANVREVDDRPSKNRQ